MTLLQAILSNRPFRRPSWIETDFELKWVVYNPKHDMFDWANDDGTTSNNTFGYLHQLVNNNDTEANDYEIMP